MQNKITFWMEEPETEATKALWTVSVGGYTIAKALPRDAAINCLDEYLEGLEQEAYR